MATLQAVVDIQDRASSKFDKLTRSSNVFKAALIDLDHKLGEIERKIERITHKSISIKVDLDTSRLDAQFAALEARLMTAGHLGPDGFAMPRSGVRDNMNAVPGVAEKITRAAPQAGRTLTKGLNVQRADNGVLGFLSFAVKLALNFRHVIEKISGPVSSFFSTAILHGSRVLSMFGMTAAKSAEQAGAMASAIAPVVVGILGLTAGSFLFVMIGTALAGVIGLIASALTSLLVPIAGIATGLAAIIGVIAFAIIPMVKWVSETKQLVDEKTKLNERLRYLTKGSKEYNTTLAKRDELQQKLNKSGAEGIFTTMQTVMADLKKVIFTDENKRTWVDTLSAGLEALRPLLPIVSFLANQFSYAVKGIAEKFRDFTASGEGRMLILSFFASSIPLVEKFASALGAMVRIFMAIGVAAAPIVNKMMGDFVGWLSQTADYLSSPEGLKSLGGFFDTMYPVFKGLVELLSAFIGGVRDIGVALAPELSSVMSWLREFGGVFVKWVVETVKKYGPMLARWLKIIGNTIGILWDVATKVFDAFEPLIDLFTNIFEAAISIFRAMLKFADVFPIIDVLKIVLLVLLSPFNILIGLVENLFNWLEKLFNWIGESEFGQAMADAFETVATVLEKIIGFLSTLFDYIGKLGEIPIFGDILGSFNGGGSSNGPLPANMGGGGGMDAMTGNKRPAGKNRGRGASGAIVTQPTRALIGEAGPEAVVPLNMTRGSRRLKLGAEGGTHISGDIHVHGVQNLQQFISEVQKHIANMPRESGSGMSVG